MNYAQQQRNPTRHAAGITAVVLLHVLIIYALVTGLARTVIEVVKGPIDVKVIEEIIKKPPPPPEVVPPPPKMAAPPPPFMPPPEINIAPPPTPAPAISAVTQEAPPGPQAPVIAKTEPAPAPAVRSARVVCSNYIDVMSGDRLPARGAERQHRGRGRDRVHGHRNGQVKDTVIKSSIEPGVQPLVDGRGLAARAAQGQGQDIRVQAPLSFKLR